MSTNRTQDYLCDTRQNSKKLKSIFVILFVIATYVYSITFLLTSFNLYTNKLLIRKTETSLLLFYQFSDYIFQLEKTIFDMAGFGMNLSRRRFTGPGRFWNNFEEMDWADQDDWISMSSPLSRLCDRVLSLIASATTTLIITIMTIITRVRTWG